MQSGIARVLLLLILLIVLISPVSAAAPPTCVDWPGLECVVIPNVRTSPDGDYISGTFYLVSNESSVPLNGTQTVYNQANERSASAPIIPVPVAFSRTTYLEAWAGRNISGTLTITSSQVFSIQVIDPQIGGCRNTTDLTCMNIYLSPGGRQYSVQNTESKAFTFNHDVYQNDVLIAQESHVIGGFQRVVYQVPVSPVGRRVAANATYRVKVYVPEAKQFRVFIPLTRS